MITPAEFELMQKAQKLKEVDLDYRIHELAYLNFVASQKKPKGKNKEVPVYPNFKKFFDYKKAVEDIDKEEKEVSPHIKAVMKAREKHGRD